LVKGPVLRFNDYGFGGVSDDGLGGLDDNGFGEAGADRFPRKRRQQAQES
jgi:hypothetical protein